MYLSVSYTHLDVYKRQSESKSLESTECRVPPLDGMTEDEAKTALEKQSLKIRYEYAKSETSEKGKVIGQSIASGTVVSKQTEVILSLIHICIKWQSGQLELLAMRY